MTMGLTDLIAPYIAAMGGQPIDTATDPIYGGLGVDPNTGLAQLASAVAGQGGSGFTPQTGSDVGGAGLDWNMNNLDLITRNGVTLQPEAMRSLMQLRKQLGIHILSGVGTSYRDVATQSALYNAWQNGTRNIQAAPPGKSYHNYGLAIDMSNQGMANDARQWLLNHGWDNNVPGEWWHFSYGEAPWGGS